MIAYFGPPWNASICEETAQAPTPIGRTCFRCQIPIKDGDQGFLVPYAPAYTKPSIEPWHRECFLREIFDSGSA